MKNGEKIKLPNGDIFPIPERSVISNKEKERVVKTPNGDVIRELLDGKRVQMIGTQLGYEVQKTGLKKVLFVGLGAQMGIYVFEL